MILYMFKVKFLTKCIFRIFPILTLNRMALFCKLFIEHLLHFMYVQVIWFLSILFLLQVAYHRQLDECHQLYAADTDTLL